MLYCCDIRTLCAVPSIPAVSHWRSALHCPSGGLPFTVQHPLHLHVKHVTQSTPVCSAAFATRSISNEVGSKLTQLEVLNKAEASTFRPRLSEKATRQCCLSS
jgi:hypothetical protein